LAYSYKRDTVTIYGNVVKATHGETRTEVLGSGDGSKPFQHFPLKQPPLTYMAAPSAVGAASTLEIRVNEVLWHETDSLVGLNQNDRNYILRTEDNGNTTAIFGNGQTGARLPSGVENIRAVYRSGIGKAGNVKVEQISILATRPLGLKGVINPLPATGGADRESRDRARRNIPLAVMALDRLVSTQDYADFARTFAGIGKASAKELSNGWQQVVHVTIAGADDIPIDQNSDLYRNLLQALQQQGDPHQPIQLVMRELMVLILVANVKILPDYLWELVEPKIRAALLDTFSFERRELGQSVSLSELISTVQKVPGVDFVDVDIFDSISETEAKTITAKAESPNQPTLSSKLEDIAKGIYNVAKSAQSTVESADSANRPEKQKQPRPNIPVNLARIEQGKKGIQPAQLAIFSPEIVDTLIVKEWKA
jgi:predicted phage baseplate assembly protein